MSHDNNSIIEQHACYYLTFNVVDWIDIFIRPVFKQIIVESLNHFIEKKGLTVYAWCLMSNHLHLMAQTKEGLSLSLLANDFKKFTTKIILEDIDAELEVRRNWMMKKFKDASLSLKLIDKFHVWQAPTNSVYIDLQNFDVVDEHLEYIHNNPVHHGFTKTMNSYPWSSYESIISDKKTKLKRQDVIDLFDNKTNFIEYHNEQQNLNTINNFIIE